MPWRRWRDELLLLRVPAFGQVRQEDETISQNGAMITRTQNLYDVHQTGREMQRLASCYCSDLGSWLGVPFISYYRHICRLPYVPDPQDVETISRPAYTLIDCYGPRDCDDKAVLLAAWLHSHREPVRFVASSTRPDRQLHHTFIQLGNGLFVDATYPENENFLGNYPYFRKITCIEALTSFF